MKSSPRCQQTVPQRGTPRTRYGFMHRSKQQPYSITSPRRCLTAHAHGRRWHSSTVQGGSNACPLVWADRSLASRSVSCSCSRSSSSPSPDSEDGAFRNRLPLDHSSRFSGRRLKVIPWMLLPPNFVAPIDRFSPARRAGGRAWRGRQLCVRHKNTCATFTDYYEGCPMCWVGVLTARRD